MSEKKYTSLFLYLRRLICLLHLPAVYSFRFLLLTGFLKISPAFGASGITPLFLTDTVFRHPESALYYKTGDYMIISNMDKNTPADSLFTDYLSKMSLDGQQVEPYWLGGFSSPTGLVVDKDILYVVERNAVAVVDLSVPVILKRFSIPTKGFLNDIAIDLQDGTLYITETEQEGRIYRIKKDEVTIWMQDTVLAFSNGILVDGDNILLGVNGDHSLKRINKFSRAINTVCYLGPGNIDGIQVDEKGNYWVSHFLGNLYRITPDGQAEELMNTRDKDIFIADFCYLQDKRLLIIPSLRTNRVYGYTYED